MATPTSTDSAKATIHAFLDPLGLGALSDMAWNETLNGASWTQVLLDIRNTDTYKAAFPGMAAALKNGDIAPGDNQESQYRSLVGTYQQVNQAYGLPKGFYDSPDQIAKFIENQVSPTEYKDRVAQYSSAVMGDTETLNQLSQLYGEANHPGNPVGDLLAHYLDPTVAEPLLTQQLQASQFAAAGKTSGYGQLTAAQAEQYGARAGTTAAQAQQGFGSLVHSQELFDALPGEQAGAIGQDVQLGAAFGGSATDQEAIANRARLRVAEGSGGGGFSTTQRGVAGLGSNEV
jgi:hypothetical protein